MVCKNPDFVLIKLLKPNNLIGCGGEPQLIRLAIEIFKQSDCKDCKGNPGAQRGCKGYKGAQRGYKIAQGEARGFREAQLGQK